MALMSDILDVHHLCSRKGIDGTYKKTMHPSRKIIEVARRKSRKTTPPVSPYLNFDLL